MRFQLAWHGEGCPLQHCSGTTRSWSFTWNKTGPRSPTPVATAAWEPTKCSARIPTLVAARCTGSLQGMPWRFTSCTCSNLPALPIPLTVQPRIYRCFMSQGEADSPPLQGCRAVSPHRHPELAQPKPSGDPLLPSPGSFQPSPSLSPCKLQNAETQTPNVVLL